MKTTVLAVGRMNPITAGHSKMVDKIKDVAKEHNADHKLVITHTQDSKKNPLSVEDKVKFAKHYFPGTNIEGATKEHPTFLHHAKKLSDSGTEHLVMVAGSDRVDEYHKLLHKYNGHPGNHNFKKITVVSAGHRDPDAEGAEGMSASKLRGHAVAGEYDKFKSGLPKGDEKVHKEMYHKVRQGLKLECFLYAAKAMLLEAYEESDSGVISANELHKHLTPGEIKSIAKHPFYKDYVGNYVPGGTTAYRVTKDRNGFKKVYAGNSQVLDTTRGKIRRMVQFDMKYSGRSVDNAHLMHNVDGKRHTHGNKNIWWDHIKSHKDVDNH